MTCTNFACSFLQINLPWLIFIWPCFLLHLSSGRCVLCCVLFHAHPNSTPQKLRWNLKIWKPKDFYDFLYYPNNWDIALFVYFAALTSKQNPGIKKTLNPGLFREQIFSIDILQLWSSQSEGNLLKSVLHCYSKIQFMVYKHLIIDSIR